MRGVAADVSNDRCSALGHESDERRATARELVGKETADLLGRQQRMSVRDLASKFESGQAAAHAAAARLVQEPKVKHVASVGHEQKVKEAAMLDKPALMKKLRGLLGDLSGRVAGRNKDDINDALIAVEAMEAQWTQREMEAWEEASEARKMADLFLKASEDAKKIIEKERQEAQVEIEAARATALRVQLALEEQTHSTLSSAEQEELMELRKEVKEARRITMLHGPSKVMDMEYEIQGLRQQLTDKSQEVVVLRKKVDALTRNNPQLPLHYELQGEERLGASLAITPLHSVAPELSSCIFQWHRVSPDGSKAEPIIGATRPQYAPEPLDVGKVLRADVGLPDGILYVVATSGPVDGAPGLGNFVEALVRKGGAEFNVRVFQENGEYVKKSSIQMLSINKQRIKLSKGHTTRTKEEYSSAIYVVHEEGVTAARSLYWVAHKNLTFMLVLDTERERNAAILLARRFAFDCNIILGGPDI